MKKRTIHVLSFSTFLEGDDHRWINPSRSIDGHRERSSWCSNQTCWRNGWFFWLHIPGFPFSLYLPFLSFLAYFKNLWTKGAYGKRWLENDSRETKKAKGKLPSKIHLCLPPNFACFTPKFHSPGNSPSYEVLLSFSCSFFFFVLLSSFLFCCFFASFLVLRYLLLASCFDSLAWCKCWKEMGNLSWPTHFSTILIMKLILWNFPSNFEVFFQSIRPLFPAVQAAEKIK